MTKVNFDFVPEVGKFYKSASGQIAECLWADPNLVVMRWDGTRVTFPVFPASFDQYTECKKIRTMYAPVYSSLSLPIGTKGSRMLTGLYPTILAAEDVIAAASDAFKARYIGVATVTWEE